jgi:hypothetical protein
LLLSGVSYSQSSFCFELNTGLENSALYGAIKTQSEKVLGSVLVVGSADVDIEQLEAAVSQGYPTSTFQIVDRFVSPSDESVVIYKYVQSINGKKIENGGYTVSARGNGPVGPGPQPCHQLVSFAPFLMSTTEIKTILNVQQARNFALSYKPQTSSIGKVSLFVIKDSLSTCRSLTYKVKSVVNSKLSATYIDASNGAILSFHEIKDRAIDASTLYYNNQDMPETPIGNNQFRLESSSGVKTYDYVRISGTRWAYDDSNIPIRQSGFPWPGDAFNSNLSLHLYQTHHAAVSVISPLSDIGIDFDQYFVKAESFAGAFGRTDHDDKENAYVRFGYYNNLPLTGQFESISTYDIMGHEIAHCFISRYISGSSRISGRDGATLHEGLADIIGTYVESRVQGFADLIIGDDSPNLQLGESLLDGPGGRSGHLASHPYPCFTDIRNCQASGTDGLCPYDRSGPILTWYALLVVGDVDEEIVPVDIQVSTGILTEAITLLNNTTATIPDLRDATLAVALSHYGQCSQEYTSIAKAWNGVCVGNTPTCEFTISGPRSICDDANYPLFFRVEDPIPGATYRWYFPIEWNVQGANGSNTVTGSSLGCDAVLM